MDTSHSEDGKYVRDTTPGSHEQEMAQGKRFAFGKNWSHFLRLLDDSRIDLAKASLQHMLGRDSLTGLRFLDAGSGSGLKIFHGGFYILFVNSSFLDGIG